MRGELQQVGAALDLLHDGVYRCCARHSRLPEMSGHHATQTQSTVSSRRRCTSRVSLDTRLIQAQLQNNSGSGYPEPILFASQINSELHLHLRVRLIVQQYRHRAARQPRLGRVGTAGQYHRHPRSQHNPRQLRAAQILKLLRQHVAALQVRHHQNVRLPRRPPIPVSLSSLPSRSPPYQRPADHPESRP